MKVAVGLRRVAAGKRTSGRRAAQIAYVSCDLRTSDDSGGDSHQMDLLIFYCPERYQ